MVPVSVLVATSDPGSALPDLVRSVDAQSLPVTDFELVVVDASGDGSTARLQQLAGRRPNVTVLTAAAASSAADRIGLALQQATGQYVLVLTQQQRLAPRALELLLDRATRTGADLVVGRVVTSATSGSVVLPDDADRLDLSGVDLADCIALVRRSLPPGLPESGAALLDLPALAREADAVSALGRYGGAVRDGKPIAPDADVSLEPPAYRWGEGMLHLTVGVRLPEPVSPSLQAWLVATQGLSEVALPATVAPNTTAVPDTSGAQGEQGRPALTVSAALDPRTAEGGDRLDDGPWGLQLRLAWPGREVTLPLAPGPARSAVIDGRPYVVHSAGRAAVQLDAGALQASVIGQVPQSRASIVESAHGTLVTFDYPTLHVQGDAVLDARLLLDGFGLPARLVCQDGRARLEAYASSLAGVSAVSVVAGGGKPVRTGLRLRVDSTGRMTLENVPAATQTPGGPLVQRVRHRLPGALGPVVDRLSQVPVLRRTYRRLISR